MLGKKAVDRSESSLFKKAIHELPYLNIVLDTVNANALVAITVKPKADLCRIVLKCQPAPRAPFSWFKFISFRLALL